MAHMILAIYMGIQDDNLNFTSSIDLINISGDTRFGFFILGMIKNSEILNISGKKIRNFPKNLGISHKRDMIQYLLQF